MNKKKSSKKRKSQRKKEPPVDGPECSATIYVDLEVTNSKGKKEWQRHRRGQKAIKGQRIRVKGISACKAQMSIFVRRTNLGPRLKIDSLRPNKVVCSAVKTMVGTVTRSGIRADESYFRFELQANCQPCGGCWGSDVQSWRVYVKTS